MPEWHTLVWGPGRSESCAPWLLPLGCFPAPYPFGLGFGKEVGADEMWQVSSR